MDDTARRWLCKPPHLPFTKHSRPSCIPESSPLRWNVVNRIRTAVSWPPSSFGASQMPWPKPPERRVADSSRPITPECRNSSGPHARCRTSDSRCFAKWRKADRGLGEPHRRWTTRTQLTPSAGGSAGQARSKRLVGGCATRPSARSRKTPRGALYTHGDATMQTTRQ